MKKIIFLGYMVKPLETQKLSGISIAGNKMQWNIVKNIVNQPDYSIDCITIIPRATFPKDHNIFQHKKINNIDEKNKLIYVKYINLPILKQLSQIASVYLEARKLMKQDEVILMCYNLFPQIGIPMRYLKKKNKNCKSVCILADLPIDDKTNRNFVSSIFRKLFDKSTNKSIKKCDKFVILNKYVADLFLRNKPYIVIEGGIDKDEVKKRINKKNMDNRNIVFSGALTDYNGIKNLIEAMKLLEAKDIYLDIYGTGYLEREVVNEAKKNNNIFFYGRVPNEYILKKQSEAWLLINPRKTDDLISKLTFPSKIFEYMVSGTPVLSTKLNGFTDDYLDKMYFSQSDSPQDLANEIMKISNLTSSELQTKALEAYYFVCNNKTWDIQVKKILKFCNE